MSTDPASPERRGTSVHRRAQPTPAIAGYHVLERLGSGRNGTVYRAIQLSMQREVALRVLSGRFSRVAGFAERFMQEARSAGGVHHPNVVSCFDVGQADGQLFLAMELVSGRTLGQVHTLHKQGLAVAQALAMVVGATRGLEGIHRGGLVHGDVRLGNIFVTDDEVVKLADFGFQRSLEVLRDDSEALVDLATLAPEQLPGSGGNVDIRADLYGLGAVLYALVTGRQPFHGRSRRELEQAVATAGEQERTRIARELHDGLGQQIGGLLFLMNGLQRDLQSANVPQAETVGQLCAELGTALTQARTVSRASRSSSESSSSRRKKSTPVNAIA